MSRRFDRDFTDLHGHPPGRGRRDEVASAPLVASRPGLRLVVGALGLFWGLVLLVLLVAATVIVWAVVSSMGAPSLPS